MKKTMQEETIKVTKEEKEAIFAVCDLALRSTGTAGMPLIQTVFGVFERAEKEKQEKSKK
jgi:hypothetical protein